MKHVWRYAAEMFKYRAAMVGAVIAALLSAGSLASGLAALGIAMNDILRKDGIGLREMATKWNDAGGKHVAASWIELLPVDRFDSLLVVIIALGVLTLFGATSNFVHGYLSYTVASRTVADIRKRLYERVLRMPLREAIAQGPSAIVSRVIFDTQQLWSGFVALLSKALADLLKGLAALSVAFLTEWRLTLGVMVVGLLLGVIIKKLGSIVRRASRGSLEAYARTQKVSSEAVSQLRVVKTSGAEPREAVRFAEAVDDFLRLDLRVRTARALSSPLVEAVGAIVLGAVVVIPAKAIIDGKLEPGDTLATLGMLAVAAGCLKPLTSLYNEMQISAAAARRLRELEDSASEPGREAGRPSLPRHARSLEIRDVHLTYSGMDRPALDGVSLQIRHGETVAFVGPNGCGKTTLLSLVPRLFDADSGDVLVDGTSIRTIDIDSLRGQIGVVTQDAALFSGTIADNIAYATPGATREQVMAAAKKARAEEFILAKPDGYDTMLGESGSGLSGGQRQRLCIARAVLRDPAILILDEATSMVDADSEQKIAEALADFSKGRTCLIVAHRLSTVVHADRIVVMNAGKVEAVGRHHDLLERSETYRLIASTQLMRSDSPPPAK